MKRATGADDMALAETTWPLPCDEIYDVMSRVRYDEPTREDLLAVLEVASCYLALIRDGGTTRQVGRLRALRRIHERSHR